MQKSKWSRKFDWIKTATTFSGGTTGYTYTQQDRLEQYNQDRFIAVDSIYFKFNKYLDGVCFSYINNLNDIYRRDLLTGDGYSIFNMYNEYDVVDRVFKNMIVVDVASSNNININQQWVKIDNVRLLPGHLVLLYNQDSEFENDVYQVTKENYLQNSDYLSDRNKSDKFSCSVKLGSDADKQFFLINNGFQFPITYEPKYFIGGKSLILKNKIKYNLYNVSTDSGTTSKIIFTDYDFARKQIPENYNYFESFISSIGDTLKITYHHDEYTIRTGTTNFYTGYTSDIQNYSKSLGSTITGITGFDVIVNDQLQIKLFSGITDEVLTMQSYVNSKTGLTFTLEDSIPNYILRDLSGCTYSVRNLNVITNWNDLINENYLDYTPYSDFFDYYTETGTTNITFYPKESKFDKYFDYDGIKFSLDSTEYDFLTDNQYLKYTLYDRLKEINPSIFTSTFTGITNSYTLTGFTSEFTDRNRIKISSSILLTDIFTPYTYVNVSGDISGKTLIYSVNEYEMIIESSSTNIVSISNIDGLKNISDILYEVYMNVDYDWYIHKSDNERKYICKSYGELLTKNKSFRDNITGILYENENNEFILKLYDIENDTNLYFETVELMFLGADKKTRLPVPYKKESDNTEQLMKLGQTPDIVVEDVLDWNVLDGGYCLSYYSLFTSGLTIESGVTLNFTINSGLSYITGNYVNIVYDSGNTMQGVVVFYDYSGTTMNVSIYSSTGSGTYSNWIITLITNVESTYTNEVFDFGFNEVLGGPNDPAQTYTLIDGKMNEI